MKKVISLFVLLGATSAFADIDSVNVTVNNNTKTPYWCYEDPAQQPKMGKWTDGWRLLAPGSTQFSGTAAPTVNGKYAQLHLNCQTVPWIAPQHTLNPSIVIFQGAVRASVSCFIKNVSCSYSVSGNQATFEIDNK